MHRRTAPLALLALIPLASCGDDDNVRFAPACPIPSIPRDTADLHRFRGAGRDIIDSVLDGRIVNLEGSCTRGSRGFVTATISVSIDLTRGPAAPGRNATVSYYVAVTEGTGDAARVLDKRVYALRAEFPPNTDRLGLSGNEITLNLPVTPTKTAAAYQVNVGFQLDPAELDYNRNAPNRR